MIKSELAKKIEHTMLRPDATRRDIEILCSQSVEHGFHNVSVSPCWTKYCVERLADTEVGVDTTVGFPLGANTSYVKVEEARDALQNGASELDMVINIGALRSGLYGLVEKEIAAVVRIAHHKPVKVILENSLLTNDEKRAVCEMSVEAGASYVKTSTGFGKSGAKTKDIVLMREIVGDSVGIKAAGGIRTYKDAMAMIDAGANRIGTSAGPDVIAQAPEK